MLLDLQAVSLAFGGPALLEDVHLRIERGERIALVGRNGSGKSTLLRVISGELSPWDGKVTRAPGSRCALLTQDVPTDVAGSVYDVVAAGLGDAGALLAEHHHLALELAAPGDHRKAMDRLEQVQHELELLGGWELPTRVEATLDRLGLPQEAEFQELSGGLKRRVLLARALVGEPDLLLLDEPTNHMDVAAIEAMEELLADFRGGLLFVTHDRSFLRRLARRIIELDRGRLTDWPGDYDAYLAGKEKRLEDEATQNALFDKRLAQEEVWIRQGIKARRTRDEGRVKALEAMRVERRARREVVGEAKMQMVDAERSGKRVIEAEDVGFRYGETPILRDFSTQILRGDKIGILGPNGAGKTTLLRLLLGELQPQEGEIRFGTKIEVAYFDQQRAVLDPERTVADNVADGSDRITFGGSTRHVLGYLQDFLFAPERSRTPVKALSGGERNRLLLARLFAKPFNVLVMDEPTNDLDIDTLDLLEELLLDFKGTLLLVSHDRAFLDNVVTSTLVFEGRGRVGEYVGGYQDWLRQRDTRNAQARQATKPMKAEPAPPSLKAAAPAAKSPAPAAKPAVAATAKPRKLGFKEQRELSTLPATIEQLEIEQATLLAQLADPAFYQQGGVAIATVRDRLAALEKTLATTYARWQELESLAG